MKPGDLENIMKFTAARERRLKMRKVPIDVDLKQIISDLIEKKKITISYPDCIKKSGECHFVPSYSAYIELLHICSYIKDLGYKIEFEKEYKKGETIGIFYFNS